MGFISKAWKWIKSNTALILVVAAMAVLFIICASWYKKNAQIRKLKNELAILKAKIKIERLSTKYDIMTEKLRELTEKEEPVKEELQKIGDSLRKTLSEDMNMDEILKRFHEVGLIEKVPQ